MKEQAGRPMGVKTRERSGEEKAGRRREKGEEQESVERRYEGGKRSIEVGRLALFAIHVEGTVEILSFMARRHQGKV